MASLEGGSVMQRRTSEGRKYAQIAAAREGFYGRGDPAVYYGQGYAAVEADVVGGAEERGGCGNPSVYRVNECWEGGGAEERKQGDGGKAVEGLKGTKSLAMSKGEELYEKSEENAKRVDDDGVDRPKASPQEPFLAPIPPSDNESYYLGITDDYLLPPRDSEEIHPDPQSKRNAQPRTILAPSPQLTSEGSSKAGNSKPGAFPRLNFKTKATQGQPESSAVFRSHKQNGSQTPKSSLRVITKAPATRARPLSPEVATASSFPCVVSPQVRLPQTPRNSIERSKTDIQPSPTPNGYAKVTSLHSANGSIADDGQSETSVGIPMQAQSAEVVRAGQFNGDFHRFPRPGPAPVGALPSLPEGHSSRTSIVILPSIGPDLETTLPSIDSSPTRAPSGSPAKKYRYRPLDDVVNADAARLLKVQTRSPPASPAAKPSAEAEQTGGPSHKESKEDTSAPKVSQSLTKELIRTGWQEKRTQSRRELITRDLNRLRSQKGPGDSTQATAGKEPSDEAGQAHTAAKPDMRESYSSPALLPSGQNRPAPIPTTGMKEIQPSRDTDSLSALSPILVVAEQEPIAIQQPSTGRGRSFPNGKRSSRKRHVHKDSFPQPAIPLPSFPSSDEESICCAHRSRIVEGHGHSHAQTVRSFRSSVVIQDLEARFEARIAELERKNTLLLNAFVAVINTPAGYSSGSVTMGDRLSSSSGRTSSGLNGQRSSGQSGSKDGPLDGISEIYTSSGEIATKVAMTHKSVRENGKGDAQGNA